MSQMSETEDQKIEGAKAGDAVKIHFTCKLEDGTVFDTSAGKEPLDFIVGEHQVMQGLEEAVIGMKPGESKSVIIPPDKAFGPHLEEKVHVVNRDQFPRELEPMVGMKFEIKQEDGVTNVVRVTDVSDMTVTLDTNLPLAGKELFFDIEIIEVKQTQTAAADESYKKGIALQDKGQIDEAISYYQKAVGQNPNHTGAYYNLGVAFQEKGLIDQAILYYEIAIGFNQEFTEAHHNLGVAFNEKGKFDEALSCFQRVLQLKPDHAGAYYSLGNTLVAKGQFNDAMQSYKKAIEINPGHADAQWSLGLINLRLGNFEEGWKGYEWRWELKDVMPKRDFSQPLWDGHDISGRTILLHAEQGFGDTLQFIRYAPLVAQRGAKIVVECQKELVSLLKDTDGVSRVIARGEELPDFEVHCPLLSLPLVFGTKLKTIPAKIPYVNTDPALVRKWRSKIEQDKSAVKVGLVWAGNPKLKFGHSRSCPIGTFSKLAQRSDVVFYSLQKGEAEGQAKNPPEGIKLIDTSEEIHDFSDTAAIIKNLDLVISIDTSAAHLAGSLGKPVWVLLPFVPDWRWMTTREDSPWYPTMRLFRQPAAGDWESVINHIKDALNDFGRS
jgi:FKBP-type peptidyl-prolyl cis-trans isomerase 2